MPKVTEQALFEAVEINNMGTIKKWLKKGGNPNIEDENGNRLIELLVAKQSLEGVKILSLFNPDMSVKQNKKGEYNKPIIDLVNEKNTELENFIELETAFYEKDFRRIEIKFDMNNYLNHRSALSEQNKILYKPPFRQIVEFVKSKLQTLDNNFEANNPDVIKKHMEKLNRLSEFIKGSKYFNNHKIRKFLDNIIEGYKITQEITSETYIEYIQNYYKEEKAALLGDKFFIDAT